MVSPETAARLRRHLPLGARVGESSVVSHCVHVLTPADPDAVTILTDRDAGAIFYGRTVPGEIVHLDIFHAPATVPPPAVAAAFREALRGHGGSVDPDRFDLQTGAGGGRVSGDLRGGRGPSVLAAHRGHVHLAGLLPPAETAFCFPLIAAVERAVVACGAGLRRPERVFAALAGEGGPARGEDLADYAALADSQLRGSSGPDLPASPPAAAADDECGVLQAAHLAEDLGGIEAARRMLDALSRPVPVGGLRLPPAAGWRGRDAVARLVQAGWAECSEGCWRLTPAGLALRALFGRRLREIECALRSAVRRVSSASAVGGRPGRSARGGAARLRQRSAVLPRRSGAAGELAPAATVLAAAARTAAGPAPLRVSADDLRLVRRRRRKPVDLCLLLDASASMDGGRMRAAKLLARNLLLTSRDRVAVMAFQERAAVLAVPLTRNYAAAERGLRAVEPAGLTPLGTGLAAARCYLRRSHARNALLLLVTDGIPTVSGDGSSPLEEALTEAGRLRGCGVALCCIGLEPNERYLGELARRAGGRLHVVAELRPELLAAVAQRERLRRGT